MPGNPRLPPENPLYQEYMMKYKNEISNLLRQNIRSIKPYSSARSEFTGQASIFLDANENYMSFVEVPSNRYPDPLQKELRSEISQLKGVPEDQMFLGNGSDEAIDLLFRAFADPRKDRAVIMPPTYGVYQVFADINDVETSRVPLLEDTFSIDLQAIDVVVNHIENVESMKLLFICSPNNPTGNHIPLDQIEFVLHSFPGIVVVDEAYQDFNDGESALSLLKNHWNLVVLQTFSKAWGLADARVGMAFADPDIINIMNSIKYPYNMSGPSQRKAQEAVKHHERVLTEIGRIKESRSWLSSELEKLPFVQKVFPSDANFLLVKVDDADRLYADLRKKGIIIRNRSRELNCSGCVRITIGAPEENRILVETMETLQL